ncbi:MAG: hypothetical protein AB7V43_04190 [Acidimicrobiia bacterium]
MSIITKRVVAIAVAATAAGAGLFATAQAGVTTVKTYTASTSTPSLTFASTQSATITLTNTSSNGIVFKAAKLTIPAGLSVTSASISPTAGEVEIEGGKLEIEDVNIGNVAPNNKVTVTIQLSATPAACGNFLWRSDVRQSNDFNGRNNKLTLVGSDVTMKTPCNSATITCTAGDSQNCATGTIVSPAGGTASVVVNDSDGVSGTLTASLTTDAYQCAEYTATSDQLAFNITVTNAASLTGLTKTVSFSAPLGAFANAWEYQVCFKAPYAFKAFLPSQLLQDFNTGNFDNNTQVHTDGQNKGLLLPCSAGHGAPCVLDRTIASGRINITVSAPAADPAVRF